MIDYPSIYPIDPHWTSYTILDGYINFIFQSWLLFSAKSPCLLGHFQYHPQISWSFSPKKIHRFLWFLPKKTRTQRFTVFPAHLWRTPPTAASVQTSRTAGDPPGRLREAPRCARGRWRWPREAEAFHFLRKPVRYCRNELWKFTFTNNMM